MAENFGVSDAERRAMKKRRDLGKRYRKMKINGRAERVPAHGKLMRVIGVVGSEFVRVEFDAPADAPADESPAN